MEERMIGKLCERVIKQVRGECRAVEFTTALRFEHTLAAVIAEPITTTHTNFLQAHEPHLTSHPQIFNTQHLATPPQTATGKMAPITTASNEETHADLLNTLDMYKISKPFRNPNWRPPQRRNKNLKQILSEAQRAQQSSMNTQQNSGASTPQLQVATDGSTTPASMLAVHPNPAQASQDLSRLVLEKNMKLSAPTSTHPNGAGAASGTLTPSYAPTGGGPSVTYTSLTAAPSLKPKKKYCDITGLPARYKDPKTGLYYYNAEVYAVVRGLATYQVQEYLGARGAGTVLK